MYYILVRSDMKSDRFECKEDLDKFLKGSLDFEWFVISESDIEKVKVKKKLKDEKHTVRIKLEHEMYEWFITEDEEVYRVTKSTGKIKNINKVFNSGDRVNDRVKLLNVNYRTDLLWMCGGDLDEYEKGKAGAADRTTDDYDGVLKGFML